MPSNSENPARREKEEKKERKGNKKREEGRKKRKEKKEGTPHGPDLISLLRRNCIFMSNLLVIWAKTWQIRKP